MELDNFLQEGDLRTLKVIKYFNNSENVKFLIVVRLCIKSK